MTVEQIKYIPLEGAPAFPSMLHTVLTIIMCAAYMPFLYPEEFFKVLNYRLTDLPYFLAVKFVVGVIVFVNILRYSIKALRAERGY